MVERYHRGIRSNGKGPARRPPDRPSLALLLHEEADMPHLTPTMTAATCPTWWAADLDVEYHPEAA